MATFDSFQSLYQLSIAMSVAVLYFYDYQEKISEEAVHELDSAKEDYRRVVYYDRKRVKDSDPSSGKSNIRRYNHALALSQKIKILGGKLSLSTSRIWGHVDFLRDYATKIQRSWFAVGSFHLGMLLLSTGVSKGNIGPITIVLLLLLFISVHLYPIYLIYLTLKRCKILENSVRRRLRLPGDRSDESKILNGEIKGLDNIIFGDEPGAVYFLTGQIRLRLENFEQHDSTIEDPEFL